MTGPRRIVRPSARRIGIPTDVIVWRSALFRTRFSSAAGLRPVSQKARIAFIDIVFTAPCHAVVAGSQAGLVDVDLVRLHCIEAEYFCTELRCDLRVAVALLILLRDLERAKCLDLILRRAWFGKTSPVPAGEILSRAESWRPWRAYAAMLLWRHYQQSSLPGDRPGSKQRRR